MQCAFNTGYIKWKAPAGYFPIIDIFRFTGFRSTKTDSHIEWKPHTFHPKYVTAKYCLKQVNFVRKFADFKDDI